jgi:hypothetical protein
MNKTFFQWNHRVMVGVAVILTLAGSLAAAPLPTLTHNVQVSVANGNLILLGSDLDNNIIITENSVSARMDTTVNGQRHIFIPEGVTNDVIISMRGGNDFVRVELPGSNFAIPHDLVVNMGPGKDMLELLQVKAPNETRINTGLGSDIVFIDGVFHPNGYVRSEFTGKFTLFAGRGADLLEFHNAIFHGPVDVRLGPGIDGACSTEDSEFQMPDQASFNGGFPSVSPGDGFVAASLEFTNITGFENFPDDCSFLGGRF